MAVVAQETHLAFDYSVLEVVLMGRYPHLGAFQIEGPRDIELAREALAATGTLRLEERDFTTLSGGEKQRVIIAAALAQISASERTAANPAVLLLDEPTAALDLKYQLETAALLRALHRGHALSVVVSTHDLNFAAALCHTLVLLKDGQVLASGTVDQVLTPALIRKLYDVEADVARHPRTGHLTVVPTRGTADAMTPIGRRLATTLLLFGGLAAAAIVGAPLIGSTPISLARVFDRSIPFADNTDAQIFFVARLPRTLAGALVGAMLASAGRGVPGAAAQPAGDAVHARRVGRSRARGDAGDHLRMVARHGSAHRRRRSPASPVRSMAVGIVYLLAPARHRGLSTNVLLLAGVTMNAFFSALILFVQYFADFAETFRILRWLMGDLDVSSYQPLLTALPLVIVSFAVFAWLARPLNLLNLGPDAAETRGLHVLGAQRAAFLSASLATGAAVSVGGPVGFVGIVVPAPGAVAGRLGSSDRAAGVGAVRRRVPDRLRCPGAHGHVTARVAGGGDHGADRRAVLPLVAGEAHMTVISARTRPGRRTENPPACRIAARPVAARLRTDRAGRAHRAHRGGSSR